MKTDPTDTEWTDFPVCPHCGYNDEDYFELGERLVDGNELKVACGSCGKDFHLYVHISTNFTSRKLDERGNPLPINCEGEGCTRCSGEYCEHHGTEPCDCDVTARHLVL